MAGDAQRLSRRKTVLYTAVVLAVAVAFFGLWRSAPKTTVTVSYATIAPTDAPASDGAQPGTLLEVFRLRMEAVDVCTVVPAGDACWRLQSGDALTAELAGDVKNERLFSLSYTFRVATASVTPQNAIEEQFVLDTQAAFDAQAASLPLQLGAVLEAFDADMRISAATEDAWCALALDSLKDGASHSDTFAGLTFTSDRFTDGERTFLVCTLIENGG